MNQSHMLFCSKCSPHKSISMKTISCYIASFTSLERGALVICFISGMVPLPSSTSTSSVASHYIYILYVYVLIAMMCCWRVQSFVFTFTINVISASFTLYSVSNTSCSVTSVTLYRASEHGSVCFFIWYTALHFCLSIFPSR